MFGETGEMNIILGRKPDTLVVPTRALQVDQVLIVDDGIVEQRTVKVGFKSLELVEILDGLNGGEQVIVADQDTFRIGQRRARRAHQRTQAHAAQKVNAPGQCVLPFTSACGLRPAASVR